MRKVALILTVFLLNTLAVDAQYRDRRPRDRRMDYSERMDYRADRMTHEMAITYDLNDKQKDKLSVLNSEWVRDNWYGSRNGRYNNRHGRRGRGRCHYDYDDVSRSTPGVYREARLKEESERLEAYKAGLKEILTKKQYKEYEKRVEKEIEFYRNRAN